MGIIEIISAIVLIIACVFIVLVVLMQDTKQGMSQTIAGGSADNYYQKNSGRSNEAKLNRMTKIAAFIFFIVALLVNFIVMYSGNFKQNSTTSGTTSSVTSTTSETSSTESDTSSTTSDTSSATSDESTASDTSSVAESSDTTSSDEAVSSEAAESAE